MNKNKILFFAQSGVGGGERMTVNIAKWLDTSKYEVVFYLVYAPLGNSDLQDFIPAEYRVERLENKNPVHLTNEFRKVLRREKPDMVFCSAMHYNRKLLFLSLLFPKCKFIIRNENYLFARTKAQKMMMSLSYPLADLIITQTEEMSDELLKAFRLKKNRVVCVHNPVDTKLVDSKLIVADSVPVPEKPEGVVRYIAVGRFMRQKGFDLLAEAFKYVLEKQPNSELIILGNTQGNCADNYNMVKDKLCSYGIEDKVLMPGYTDNPYAYEIKSDCFVLSSRWEGLPNVLIEALYLGLPAAAFKCIPIIERIVEEGKTGFLAEKEDPKSLADAMLKAPKLGKIKSTYKSSTPEDFANLFEYAESNFANLSKVNNLQWREVKRSIKKIARFILTPIKAPIDARNKKKLYNLRKVYFEDLKKYIDKDTTIISSNCFAGRIMQDLGMQYNSPTLGLFFNGQDYAKFLLNLKYYLTKAELTFPNSSKLDEGNKRHQSWSHWYPIGLLDNEIEIHFLHYHTEEEAAEKWYRRASRVNFEKLIIIGMEQNWCRESDIIDFDNLPFQNKYFFATKDYALKSIIPMSEFAGQKKVGDPYRKGHIFYHYLVKEMQKIKITANE